MVHFVGAGPGATDLITMRGHKYLSEADVIIYAGSLVNKELLSYAKEGAEIYNSAHMTLEEVVDVIQKAEKENKDTVRLHTGDPSIYGAIREQIDLLKALDIRYDVVPGVSSFFGAAASLSAEYTLPNVSQSVIITRMEGRTPVPERESIRSFAAHKSTMVLFLSSGLTEELSKELIAGGYEKETPVAVVYKATWPDEKIFRCTVQSLPQTMKDNNITKTALILVGNFLGDDYERSELYNPKFSHEFREGIK
ncbi:precorrin-4 C(11)-methyltransferase [Sedimentibacter hydroxybenzoicus DSM 7310]|uniref:Precorrin-4 C(11)-methyltransferase n=1 Tax=Sedimentibacter hydroxybenzoicus DSM 7310 TaxID=1123245 RepID=A0A974BLI9_SEDHY|nr:precorrin-4 C(11)-methyltransferase [Sedimentibacter hydroxybenzoicus]NYB75046.1 precorrin-4 C(11)-methyltransferase [Sedimentibacter hydroxybenzoicus DSM 7310]